MVYKISSPDADKKDFYDIVKTSAEKYQETKKEQIKEIEKEIINTDPSLNKGEYFRIIKQIAKLEKEKKILGISNEYKEHIEKEIDQLQEKSNKIELDSDKDKSKALKKTIDNDLDKFLKLEKEFDEDDETHKDETHKKELEEIINANYDKYEDQLKTGQFKELIDDMIKRLPLPRFQKFVKENCTFGLKENKKKKSGGYTSEKGISVEKILDKFDIKIGQDTLYEKSEQLSTDRFGFKRYSRSLRPGKVAFLIGQVFACLIKEPKNWKKVAPKIKITEGSGAERSWIDFCGLCMSLPDEAKKMSPEAYKLFIDRMEGSKKEEVDLAGGKAEEDEKKIILDLAPEHSSDYEMYRKFWARDKIEFMDFILNFKYLKGLYNYWRQHSQIIPETNYRDRAMSRVEEEAYKQIALRDDPVTERDRSTRNLIGTGRYGISFEKKILLRATILADCKTSDFAVWRLTEVLLATDELYRETKGELITEESFAFLCRASRVAHRSGRPCTKNQEYKRIEPSETYKMFDCEQNRYVEKIATEMVFVRKDRQSWTVEACVEMQNISIRGISKVAKEMFDQMKDFKGEWMNPNEKFRSAPLDPKDNNGKEDKEWDDTYVGQLSSFLPEEFVKRLLESMNLRGNVSKIDPDAIATIALLIASELKMDHKNDLEKFGLGASSRRATSGEHARTVISAAYKHYKNIFLQNDELLSYINFYIRDDGIMFVFDKETQKEKVIAYDPNLDPLGYIESQKKAEHRMLQNLFIDKPNIEQADKMWDEYSMGQDYETREPYTSYSYDKAGNKTKIKRDNTCNNLMDEFFTDAIPSSAVEKIKFLHKAIKELKEKVEDKIRDSELPFEVQEIIKRCTFENIDKSNDDDRDLRTYSLIMEDVMRKVGAEMDISQQELFKIEGKMQEAFNSIRPFRTEFVKLKTFGKQLGINDYFSGIDKYYEIFDKYPKNKFRKDVEDIFSDPEKKEKQEEIMGIDKLDEKEKEKIYKNKSKLEKLKKKGITKEAKALFCHDKADQIRVLITAYELLDKKEKYIEEGKDEKVKEIDEKIKEKKIKDKDLPDSFKKIFDKLQKLNNILEDTDDQYLLKLISDGTFNLTYILRNRTIIPKSEFKNYNQLIKYGVLEDDQNKQLGRILKKSLIMLEAKSEII